MKDFQILILNLNTILHVFNYLFTQNMLIKDPIILEILINHPDSPIQVTEKMQFRLAERNVKSK